MYIISPEGGEWTERLRGNSFERGFQQRFTQREDSDWKVKRIFRMLKAWRGFFRIWLHSLSWLTFEGVCLG
ncbi:MAG: hypothetical protein ACTS4Y_01875 [Candidatus Hodgkinia cicadicola]